jgi:antitoxin VapB
LPGYDAIMRKDGDKPIIETVPPKSILALLATLATLDEDFPSIVDAVPASLGSRWAISVTTSRLATD